MYDTDIGITSAPQIFKLGAAGLTRWRPAVDTINVYELPGRRRELVITIDPAPTLHLELSEEEARHLGNLLSASAS